MHIGKQDQSVPIRLFGGSNEGNSDSLEEQLGYLALINKGVKGKFLPPISQRKMVSAFSFTLPSSCWSLTLRTLLEILFSDIIARSFSHINQTKCLFISPNKKYVPSAKLLALGEDFFVQA